MIYDLVTIGTVSKATAHLNSNGSDVYSLTRLFPPRISLERLQQALRLKSNALEE